jgi:hypothetical protein
MGWAVTLMGYALFLFFPLNLCRLPDKAVGKEFLKKNKNKKHLCRLPHLAVGKKNARRHGGRFLCRPPFDSRQIADCLHVAVGKESLCRPGLCRLPEWNAVGKVFADCIQAFADCFWQSAKVADCLRLAVGKVATSAIRARPDPTAVAASTSAIRARPLPDPTASRGASPSPSASPSP